MSSSRVHDVYVAFVFSPYVTAPYSKFLFLKYIFLHFEQAVCFFILLYVHYLHVQSCVHTFVLNLFSNCTTSVNTE